MEETQTLQGLRKNGLKLTGHKFKYSCRMDKPVQTNEDYIEELEMRFEDS